VDGVNACLKQVILSNGGRAALKIELHLWPRSFQNLLIRGRMPSQVIRPVATKVDVS
jgi:hypothetical protein